ncbi:hypothetical protein Bxe_C0689 [Paraburkholderia xenovorans LB400]|uniref:Uncharacterized protein n=1 Tax=Paraburkholderia xenovorans (strain LB400) TaxID=266265 RepID=Q13H52_PARXL|nr:hypothetical protein Bxe_C0689 [Paraburkholderia xenovorans LB400]
MSSDDNIQAMTDRDHSLDTLLELDGVMYTVDDTGCCWVKFEVARIAVSPERPHGLKYSLTLHDEKGTRLLGFDNAHPVRDGCRPRRTDADRVRPQARWRAHPVLRLHGCRETACRLLDRSRTVMKERSESDD